MSIQHEEIVEEIKAQWKKLWSERLDDKVRAEGIATAEYSKLFVDKGTIIHATRNYKALSFKEILERNQVENADRHVTPSPSAGGWTKFIRTSITVQGSPRRRLALDYMEPKKTKQQPKKGGRGWIHK